MLEKIAWFFANADAHRVAAPLVLPILVGLCLYQSHYPYVLVRALWARAFGDGFVPFGVGEAPAIGMTMPTLLRTREDYEGLVRGLASAMTSGYPGHVTLVAVIDGLDAAPGLVAELRRWVRVRSRRTGVHVVVTGAPSRVGKAMAADLGVQEIARLAREGRIPAKPAIYFNMDADCELGPHALDRMVRALERRSRLTGAPGTIVTSHVSIRESEYFRGLGSLLTVRGQLAVTVAREYLVAIGLGRHNAFRLLPQNGASGALYCTWMEIAEAAPRWARFLGGLRGSDWARWWLGAEPPRFDPEREAPHPEAMTGMGEDTWMSWLACAARFERGRLTLALPRTPAHALYYAAVSFVARPFRYDALAKIYTTTPTTVGALFRQRVRWNVSRIWTVQCWGWGLLYHLSIGIPALVDVVLATLFQAIVVAGLVIAPFAGRAPAMAPALFVLVEIGYLLERSLGTAIAMVVDRGERGQWKKLLGLPFAGTFHLVFNVATTVWGFGLQVLGNGYNDRFAPEETLVRGGTSRIALGYRARRFVGLALRSIVRGDVPLGWFWIGWHETPFTPNGYEGWTSGVVPPVVRAPETASLGESSVADSALASEEPTAEDEYPDSGIRPRPSLDVTSSHEGDRVSHAG